MPEGTSSLSSLFINVLYGAVGGACLRLNYGAEAEAVGKEDWYAAFGAAIEWGNTSRAEKYYLHELGVAVNAEDKDKRKVFGKAENMRSKLMNYGFHANRINGPFERAQRRYEKNQTRLRNIQPVDSIDALLALDLPEIENKRAFDSFYNTTKEF